MTRRSIARLAGVISIPIAVLAMPQPLASAAQLAPPPADQGSFSAGFKVLHPAREHTSDVLQVAAVWYPTDAVERDFAYPVRGIRRRAVVSHLAANAIVSARRAPYPLVILAHGHWGCAVSLGYLAEYLARHGYIVAATDYADEGMPGSGMQVAAERLGPGSVFPDAISFLWTARRWVAAMNERAADFLRYLEHVRLAPTRALIDLMLKLNADKNSMFYTMIDPDRIGMGGHSAGGYTTLGLIGAHPRPEMRDARIKAAAILSAGVHCYRGHIGNIAVPIIVLHGDNDPAGLGEPGDRYVVYRDAPPPKYYVVVASARHLTFSNPRYLSLATAWQQDRRVRVIVAYTAAFFDAYLRGEDEASSVLRRPWEGVAYHAYQLADGQEQTWGRRPLQ